MHLAHRYFSKSFFIKALISSFNKKHLCFGTIPFEQHKILEIAMEESLSRNDNISDIIDKFPKSILRNQKSLFHGLDANNSFLLERFNNIANLSYKIDSEIQNIKNGSLVFSYHLESIYNQTYATVLFLIKNNITLLYSNDYKNISNITFSSIIKRKSLEEKIEIDEFLSYLAIIGFEKKQLSDFLSTHLTDDKSLKACPNIIDYLLLVQKNCLNALSSSHTRSINDYCIKIYSNATIILSFIKHDNGVTKKIFAQFTEIFDTDKWSQLSKYVNFFLVNQSNKYGNIASLEDLEKLIDKQLDKIGDIENIHILEDGRLFTNSMYFIQQKQNSEKYIFEGTKKLKRFISNVALADFKDKMSVIEKFVFAIYQLATGNFKKQIFDLLMGTFEEAKNKNFNLEAVIFGLNLYNLDLFEDSKNNTNLTFILERLKLITTEDSKKRTSSSYYLTIKEQLSMISSGKLENFKDVVEQISKFETSK